MKSEKVIDGFRYMIGDRIHKYLENNPLSQKEMAAVLAWLAMASQDEIKLFVDQIVSEEGLERIFGSFNKIT